MSLRAAINAKCKECIYDPIGGCGTWRQQVEACTSPRCPLYASRPTAKAANRADSGYGSDELPEPGHVGVLEAEAVV